MSDPVLAEQIIRTGSELLKNHAIVGGAIILTGLGISFLLASLRGGGEPEKIGRDVRPDYSKRLKEQSGN